MIGKQQGSKQRVSQEALSGSVHTTMVTWTRMMVVWMERSDVTMCADALDVEGEEATIITDELWVSGLGV